ncbi:poly [ADP-ribose] polymerase tankyrase-2-like isoform X1 [Cloeon dipterum]|uniref:poly [ADP-ribose] polymerase tankyrase-2-like isoform X1 n=1 Tax=Cloeon dipterum TaxID=197152 RepID=UPI00322004DB
MSNQWVEGYTLEEVGTSHKDYGWIVSKVKNSGGTFNIKKVFRIKNSSTWNAYKMTRETIFYEMGRQTVPEKRLFHGSPWAMQIAEQGFKIQYARSNGACGAGIYFSSKSSESYTYSCKIGSQTNVYMLVCKVALGVTGFGSRLQAGTHSVISDTKHVIYNETQAYPSYLIEIS